MGPDVNLLIHIIPGHCTGTDEIMDILQYWRLQLMNHMALRRTVNNKKQKKTKAKQKVQWNLSTTTTPMIKFTIYD